MGIETNLSAFLFLCTPEPCVSLVLVFATHAELSAGKRRRDRDGNKFKIRPRWHTAYEGVQLGNGYSDPFTASP